MIRWIFISWLTLIPTQILAASDGYICTISEIQELNSTGNLEIYHGIYSTLIGTTFSISRETGEVIGMPFSTKGWKEARVLDRGDATRSFKLMITSHQSNAWVRYLYVREFDEGERKPFWGADGEQMYAGTCK
jgi:hypothetical protein